MPLNTRAFDLLLALVERAGDLVTKTELMDRVWGDVAVAENALHVHASSLRSALGADAGLIVTDHGRGYRFTAPVEIVEAATPAEQPAARQSNLPVQPTRLIGREDELAAITALLSEAATVTISGPGGIGKTRLAIAVGERSLARFRDGVWLVELAPLTDPELVASAAATTLGIRLDGNGRPAELLARALADRSMLVILDNCEHLLDAVAHLAASILAVAPGVRILATSREALRVASERIYPIATLGLPDAADATLEAVLRAPAGQLFVERVQAADARLPLADADAASVAAICRRLDGIALALELAATSAPLLGVSTLAARLDERFRILTGGRRTVLPRHRTLRAVFDWSYALLAERERILLRRLSVFASVFTLSAAEAVASDAALPEVDIVGTLAALVAKSLVAVDHGVPDSRYRLLESTRAYAGERLDESGEAARLRERHVAYLASVWERLHAERGRGAEAPWVARVAYMVDDVRAALNWSLGPGGVPEHGILLAGASRPLWNPLGLRREGVRWAEEALGRVGPETPPEAIGWLWYCVGALTDDSDLETSLDACRQAAIAFRTAGDRTGLAMALGTAGECLVFLGRDDEGEAVLAEGLSLLDDEAPVLTEMILTSALGTIRFRAGDAAEAQKLFERAIHVARRSGEDRIELMLINNLVGAMHAAAECAAAVPLCHEVIRRATGTPNITALSLAYTNLCSVLVELGEAKPAFEAARNALPLLAQLGMAAVLFDYLALAAFLDGRIEDAARLYGHAAEGARTHRFDRQYNSQRTADRLDLLLRDALPPEKRATLERAGAALDEAAAIALAFGPAVV